MHRRHLLALAATAVAFPALAPTGAEAAICFKSLPGPGAGGWEIQQDGSQAGAHYFKEGSNFDQNHGQLIVGGTAYPKIPNEQDACTTTATSISYPTRVLGDFSVRRTVTSVNGRIRRLDVITNNADVTKNADVRYAFRVLASQDSIDSESGDATVTKDDHWSVHENNGFSFPFLQWGEDDALDPVIHSDGNNPAQWKPEVGSMPDADLHYTDIMIPPHKTVRLLHMSGSGESQAAAKTAATDKLTPFSGVTKAEAATVVNWGTDSDGDGVAKGVDDCPSVKGNQANGCFKLIVNPDVGDKPADPVPPAGDPAPVPTPPAGDPAQPGGGGSTADTTAPKLTIAGIGKSAKRRALGKGLAARFGCDETCTVRVKVLTRKKGARKAAAVVSRQLTVQAGTKRSLKIKVSKRQLRGLVKQRITIAVTATDAAGNKSSATRVVRVRR